MIADSQLILIYNSKTNTAKHIYNSYIKIINWLYEKIKKGILN